MKLTCRRDNLLTACQLVSAAVAARTTKPVLSNVKAVAEGDGLTLVAFDTEVGIRYELRGVSVGQTGAAILPISQLTQILRESGDDEVTLDSTDDGTKVKAGTSRFEMPGYPVDEFPDIPAFDDGGRYHEVGAGVLRQMIRRTAFAADKKDSTRFALSGVLWEAEGQTARLVATDSKRLAVCEGPAALYGPPEAAKGSHLVPAKTMGLLERNLTDDGELVRVGLRPNEALFQTDRAMIYSRLVEGRYPPYRDIIGQTRKGAGVKVPLPVGAFLSRVRQAAIMTDDESKRVDMTFEPGRVGMQARGAATGSSEVELPLPEYDGPEVRIAFDPQYLVEFLRAVESEPTVTLEMTDGTKPALFRCGDGYQYLVMPLDTPYEGFRMADGGPENLSDILGRMFAARGWGRKTDRLRLEGAWAAAAGPEVAAATRVVAVRRGVLEVEVKGAVLLQELTQFHKRRLLGQLRPALPGVTLTDLKFRAGAW